AYHRRRQCHAATRWRLEPVRRRSDGCRRVHAGQGRRGLLIRAPRQMSPACLHDIRPAAAILWFIRSVPGTSRMTTLPMSESRRRWILAGLMATMMLAAMDITIVATAVPQIVADLGGFSLFTWVFSIYLLTQTVTIPIYGKLADLHGRKPVLIGGVLIFLAGSAACAFAWNMVALIVFRGLQGLGAGSIMATVNTLAADLYTLRERARIQGWLSSVWAVSAIVGPTLGGTFAEYVSWHWIFLVNLPVGAAAIALIGTLLHEQVERQSHRLDLAGSALVLLTVGLLIFGFMQGGRVWPWLSPASLAIFAAAVALTIVTLLVERRAAEPIMPGWLWRDRALAGSCLAMVGLGGALMGPNA